MIADSLPHWPMAFLFKSGPRSLALQLWVAPRQRKRPWWSLNPTPA